MNEVGVDVKTHGRCLQHPVELFVFNAAIDEVLLFRMQTHNRIQGFYGAHGIRWRDKHASVVALAVVLRIVKCCLVHWISLII